MLATKINPLHRKIFSYGKQARVILSFSSSRLQQSKHAASLQKALSSTLNWEAMNPTEEFANHTLHSYISFYMWHTKDFWRILKVIFSCPHVTLQLGVRPANLITKLTRTLQVCQGHSQSALDYWFYFSLQWLENSAWDRTTFQDVTYKLRLNSFWDQVYVTLPQEHFNFKCSTLLTSKQL